MNNQTNQSERMKNNLKKNKPTIVLPIINTVFSVIFLAGNIYCKIAFGKEYGLGFFIAFTVLVILFPITSWYSSYFSKKQNIKRIYNYEHESNEIVAYIKRLKSYKGIELNKNYKLIAHYQLTDQIVDKHPHYDSEHCSLGIASSDSVIITFGVSFAGIELKAYDKSFTGLCGVLPRSVWYKKHLKAPVAKKGVVTFSAEGFELSERMVIQALKNQDSYYDNKSGWMVIGEKKGTIIDEVVEIMHDVYLVIRNEEMVALWIKLESGLAI